MEGNILRSVPFLTCHFLPNLGLNLNLGFFNSLELFSNLRLDSRSHLWFFYLQGNKGRLFLPTDICLIGSVLAGHQRSETIRQQDHRVHLRQQQLGVHETEGGQELP